MIIRTKKTKNYSIIANECLRRPDLSAKAKGVWAYLMTLPDDWKINFHELVKHFKDGETSLKSALKELKEAGYLVINKVKDEKGRFKEVEWVIQETAQNP